MRVLRVLVRRNELNQQYVDIAPHELPVLAYVHGEEACRVIGELIVDRDIPDAGAEYQRLAQKYGRDKANESLEPRVSAVYGAAGRGVIELAKAIEYGQRDDVSAESFNIGPNEPAHEHSANVLQRTQHRPQAHSAPPPIAGTAKKRKAPRFVERVEGRASPDVHELPPPMQPGAADGKRANTVKQKRAEASGAPRSKAR